LASNPRILEVLILNLKLSKLDNRSSNKSNKPGRLTKKTMTAQTKYITSTIEIFSTYLEDLNISPELKEKTTILFVKFLQQKKNYDSWSVQHLEKFLETEKSTANTVILIKKFIKDFTPYQVDVFLHQFLSFLKSDHRSNSTIKNYRSDISQLISLTNANKIENLFTRVNIKNFVKDQFSKDLKAATIKRKLISISQFAIWAEGEKLVENVSFWISDVEGLFGRNRHNDKNQNYRLNKTKPDIPTSKINISQNKKRIKPKKPISLLEDFLINLEINESSKSTIKNYRSDISQFIAFIGDKTLEEVVTRSNLNKFGSYQSSKGLKPASIRRKIVSITQFAIWAEKRGLLKNISLWIHNLEETTNTTKTKDAIQPSAPHSIELKLKSQISTSRGLVETPVGKKYEVIEEKTEKKTIEKAKRWSLPIPGFARKGSGKKNGDRVGIQENKAGKMGTEGKSTNQGYKSRLKESLKEFSESLNTKKNKTFLPYFNLAMIVLFFLGIGYFGYTQFIKQAPASLAYPTTPVRPNRELSFQGRLTDTAQNPITTATNMAFRLYDTGPGSGGTQLWSSGTCSVTPDQDGIFNVGLGDDCGSEITEDVFTENSNVWLEVDVAAETLTPRQSIKTVAYALNSETVQGYPVSATGAATTNTILVMDSAGQVLLGEVSPTLKSTTGTFSIEAQALTLQTSSGSNGDIIFDPDGLGEVLSTGYFYAPGATFAATYAGGTSLVLRGGPSGTGNIQEWQNSAGTVLSAVDESGNLGIGTNNPLYNLDVTGNASVSADLSLGGQLQLGNFGTNPTSIGDGSIIYNSTDNKLYYYDSTSWAEVGSGSGGSSYWQEILGAVSPLNITDDVLVGGTATSSALVRLPGLSGEDGWFNSGGNVGIGTTTPLGLLNVEGAVLGKALTIFNETGDQDIIAASASGVTQFRVARDGYVYGERFVDITNSDYYIDPASAGDSAILAGNVGIGTTTTVGKFNLEGAITGKALSILNETGNQDVLVASVSGVTKFRVANDGGLWSSAGSLTSGVSDSSSAVGFTLDTDNTISTYGSKLLSVNNNGVEKMYLDADGNLYVSGNIISGGGGYTLLVTNKSGGSVATKGIVIVDTTNNSAFTTTTTPYTVGSYGVVIGVGLGVSNDADGDGVCDADDTCIVAVNGEAEVTTTNATTASVGDYVFTSDTAGSAVAQAKQYDGLVGIVTDVSGSASGYIKIVFKAQPQVTATAAMDKYTKHNIYQEALEDYLQTAIPGYYDNLQNIRQGLYFDALLDESKVNHASNSAAIDTDNRKAGLWGGETLNATNTDSAGNTFLGAADANDVYYYDRTQTGEQGRDSTPATLVDLGIDPYWYNGISLVNPATGSGSLANNPPGNLTEWYNGGLIEVNNTITTEDGYIDIEIVSQTNTTLTFNWRSSTATTYSGDQLDTAVFGTATSLVDDTSATDTGVDVTFTKVDYHPGDTFRIASWFIEPATANDRGAKQQFPERSNIIAGNSNVDIIDADTNLLWMRFSQGSNYAIGGTSQVVSGSIALNGTVYVTNNTSGLYNLNFISDISTNNQTNGVHIKTRGLTNRNTTSTDVLNTSTMSIINMVVNDVSAAVIPNQPTQEVTIGGWGYIQGDGTTEIEETINLPYKFNTTPQIVISPTGHAASVPEELSNCNGSSAHTNAGAGWITNNSFQAILRHNDSSTTLSSSHYRCYTWTATGTVSPKQFVAVATDGGVSVINETDQSVIDVYYDSSWDIVTQVALTNKDLYYNLNNATNYQTIAKYGIGGYTTDQTTAAYGSMAYAGGGSTLGVNTSYTEVPTSLLVTQGTSTIDNKSNTIYTGFNNLLSVIQEKQSGGNADDGDDESNGSVKYYTKDYISEEMVGDIRGMWPLSSNYGSGLSDASVKAGTLTNNNSVTFTSSGVRGTAGSFNGSNQYLTAASSSNFDASTTMTFGAWIKTSSYTDQAIVQRVGNWGGTSTSAFYMISVDTDGTAEAWWRDNTDGVTQDHNSSKIVADGKWHHVLQQRDGSISRIFIDGQLDGEVTLVETGTYTFDDPFVIGGTSGGSPGQPFNGLIDEPFITATVISPDKIKKMYEVGKRALEGSHGTNDYQNELAEDGVGTGAINNVSSVGVDWNNEYMYVGMEDGDGDNDGWISKIDLDSDTQVQSFTTATDPSISDDDATSLSVGYGLELVGMDGVGAINMSHDSEGNDLTGSYYSDTITAPDNFSQAYLWVNAYTDSDDTSNSITMYATNDGGSNWVQGQLTNTDSNQSVPEKEYYFNFSSPGSSLAVRADFARGSTASNAYITNWGITWIDSDSAVANAPASGLYTQSDAAVASGSYVEIAHNGNTSDLIANGWIYNTTTSKWEQTDNINNDALGGTITYADGYTIHTFTSDDTFIPSGSGDIEYLVVGGGGGGGNAGQGGGGGGGGEVLEGSSTLTPGSSYTVTIGAGGGLAAAGGNTVINTISTALGGGAGGANSVGGNGGNGGGGSSPAYAGGSSTGTGNSGGSGGGTFHGGGGGGMSGVGGDGVGGVGGGAGGDGLQSSITGSAVWYGGGGGGGTAGSGGNGGGGTGAVGGTSNAVAGTDYLGGGGGGQYSPQTAAVGGKGVAIIRYKTGSLSPYKIVQQDTNTVRLYNYSGSTQNLRLDAITGSGSSNAGSVSLHPLAADVDSMISGNSIWINKTGTSGNLLKLQTSGVDKLVLDSTGTLTLDGNFLPSTDDTYSLGATASARWKDLYLGPASLHIQANTTDSGYSGLGLDLDYALGIDTAGSLNTSLNGTDLMTIAQSGNVGIGTTTPAGLLNVEGAVTGKALSIFNETGNQDIIAASASGTTKFRVARDGYVYGERFTDITNSAYFVDPAASGTSAAFAGNVGIGDTSPDHKLDVAGNIGLDASSYINFGDTDGTTGYGFRDNSGAIEYKDSGGDWAIFGGGLSYSSVSTATTMAGNTGYITTHDSTAVVLTLPASPTVGDIIEVAGEGDAGWTIKSNASVTSQKAWQRDVEGELSASSAITLFQSDYALDSVRLVCVKAGTDQIWVDTLSGASLIPYAINIDALIVAGGGGGGGDRGGGGGGGEMLSTSQEYPVTTTEVVTVVVGAGGAGGVTAPSKTSGAKGSNSSYASTSFSSTAEGGGYGGVNTVSGGAGGNGGGGGGEASTSGGTGNQYNGGNGAQWTAGGGGGPGGAGSQGTAGLGLSSSITGTPVTYAAGGGVNLNGGNGGANTGEGGDGAGNNGYAGNGGSGVVILKVLTANYSGTTTGSPTVTTDGAYTIIKYTANGTYTIVSGADLAEWMKVGDSNLDESGKATVTPGDLLCIDTTDSQKVVACNSEYAQEMISVVTTAPGLVLGQEAEGTDAARVVLTGRAPVKVTTDNGSIKAGDPITSSSIPGVGMKATSHGQIIGYALEDYDGEEEGLVMVFINPNWFQGNISKLNVDNLGNITIPGSIYQTADQSLYENIKPLESALSKLAQLNVFSYNTIEDEQTKLGLSAQDIQMMFPEVVNQSNDTGLLGIDYTQLLSPVIQAIGELSDSIKELNQKLDEQINDLISSSELISPLGPDTIINIASESGSLVINNANNISIAEISDSGDLSLLGSLNADSISTLGDVDIAGSLTAGQTSLGSLLTQEATVSGNLAVTGTTTLLGDLYTTNINSATISATTVATTHLEATSSRIAALEAGMAELEHIKATTAEIVNATVSGTLYADNIYNFEQTIANSLQTPGILDLITGANESTASSSYMAELYETTNSSGFEAIAMADLDLTLEELSLTEDDVTLTGSALFIEKYFKVNGAGYISDSLAVGNSIFAGNALVVGSGDTTTQISNGIIAYTTPNPNDQILKIQPTGQGSIDLLAGLVIINGNGLVTVNGDFETTGNVKVGKTLLADLIQPTDFGNPLQVQVAGVDTQTGEIKESRFEIINEVGAPVATFSAKGRAEFAGGIGIGSEDLGSSILGEFTTNKTSGKAIINSGSSEVKIKSNLINDKTLVYITAVGSTDNQVLYLKSQSPYISTISEYSVGDEATTSASIVTPATNNQPAMIEIIEQEGEFIVGFDNATALDTEFNWWIVN
jgi:hypothetical protein